MPKIGGVTPTPPEASHKRRRLDLRRGAEIAHEGEDANLEVGLDFRAPRYRREVFLRFYEFHLENATHPGCVYFAIPWLIKRHKLDREQQFWLAFINGNTQNIVTSWLIFQRFHKLPTDRRLEELSDWFEENYGKLAWDTDRRHHKKDFIKAVECYANLVGSSQQAYFGGLEGTTEYETFRRVWEVLRRDFYTFGRLSSFSYSEYLRIIDYRIDCDTLFLDDMSGSKSHRNGLAKVLGRDDLDWHDSGTFRGDYFPEELGWLEAEAEELRAEVLDRLVAGQPLKQGFRIDQRRHVGFFTLESALCTYKSWHRPNRRYPNVYADMFHDRIRLAEERWGTDEVKFWWQCRAECLPEHLLLEKCFHDPGLCPEKQNYYRTTGSPIMMSRRWPEFDNSFDRRVWRGLGL